MARLFAAILASLAVPAAVAATPQVYDTDIDDLVASFEAAVVDTDALEALEERAEALSDRIREDWRRRRDTIADEEKDRLRQLEDQADALADVIRTVGQVSDSSDVSLEEFDLAGPRLGLDPVVVTTVGNGVDLIRVDVGGFKSFLLRNPGPDYYTSRYEWTASGLSQAQGGSRNLDCRAITAVLNSRDRETESIEFTLVKVEKNIFMEPCS